VGAPKSRTVSFALPALVACVLVLGLATSAEAPTNVVPNPGFELFPNDPGCFGATVCRWGGLNADISRDTTTNPRSGTASMQITGPAPFVIEATSGGPCIQIAAGTHFASFWYRTSDAVATQVLFGASFYPNSTCSVATFGFDQFNLPPITDGQWHQLAGVLTAPPGTGSLFFAIGIGCSNCGETLTANFDDVDFEAEVVAVTVASFRAARSPDGIVIRWRTGTEADELGFNVYRQQHGRRVRVNKRLLPAHGGVQGAMYSFVDRSAPRNAAVRYWLQDVDRNGARTWHGPIRVAAA
jgi:hypothetical protein